MIGLRVLWIDKQVEDHHEHPDAVDNQAVQIDDIGQGSHILGRDSVDQYRTADDDQQGSYQRGKEKAFEHFEAALVLQRGV